ncbi:pimeloyl-ACP methyl ester carboxylesterase [Actinomycetospora succinea]|uniref:Pimeloyl-ACP methyl ester carboxylesterase n=1 Tax=Actinomycetospora succinea TaxID=663603 RepID=A0A4R6V9Z8_9PSEU|nr:alpha/beta hydrolase [Actinomycetospora succinea]TDQ58727.1 pimeloyl-ACP methyl ester carboxylesterase [Actinomycetospora succinea]
MTAPLEAADRGDTFVSHAFDEHLVDLGEIRMNYATAGDPSSPPLLLIPGQSESWWGYAGAMPLLAEHFHVHAVDLRGQGRSTWTPGRYTIDIFGHDLERFIDLVIGRPTLVSGMSSGGVLSAWLSAFAKPGQIRAAVWEDPPVFACQTAPAVGPGIRQAIGPVFEAWNTWLGDQWKVGDWDGLMRAMPTALPPEILGAMASMIPPPAPDAYPPAGQNLREYDPEWGRAFTSGAATASCDHVTMLRAVRVPVLFTHHFRTVDEQTGRLVGASTDQQARRACELVAEAGQRIDYRSFPEMPHSMHEHAPKQYVETVLDWVATLEEEESR